MDWLFIVMIIAGIITIGLQILFLFGAIIHCWFGKENS